MTVTRDGDTEDFLEMSRKTMEFAAGLQFAKPRLPVA
jgi:hypothetical protein